MANYTLVEIFHDVSEMSFMTFLTWHMQYRDIALCIPMAVLKCFETTWNKLEAFVSVKCDLKGQG